MVPDNYDVDIKDKVEIFGDVDTFRVGEYKLEYRVRDSKWFL